MPNTVILKGRGQRKEAAAGEAITPGHLVTINTSGQLIKHATALVRTAPTFAVEYENLNPTSARIAGGIDDAYASGDYCQAETLPPGSWVYALLAAAAPAIVKGDPLESAGNGTLRKVTTGVPIARALEAVDNSGGGTQARIRAEIM